MASGAGVLAKAVTVIDQPVAIADDLTGKQGTARGVRRAKRGQAACLYGCVWWWGKTPVIVVSVCGACVFCLDLCTGFVWYLFVGLGVPWASWCVASAVLGLGFTW